MVGNDQGLPPLACCICMHLGFNADPSLVALEYSNCLVGKDSETRMFEITLLVGYDGTLQHVRCH